jgi:hypothetical protein
MGKLRGIRVLGEVAIGEGRQGDRAAASLDGSPRDDAGLVQAVAGWTVLLVLAGLAARTHAAWVALAIVYLLGLAPLFLLVVNRQRGAGRSARRGP